MLIAEAKATKIHLYSCQLPTSIENKLMSHHVTDSPSGSGLTKNTKI